MALPKAAAKKRRHARRPTKPAPENEPVEENDSYLPVRIDVLYVRYLNN